MIIQNLTQVQKYVNVSNAFTATRLNAHEAIAFANFINKYFSTEFCELILASTSTNEAIVKAKSFIEGAVVYFSMFQWAQTGEVVIGDLGILREENENSKAAYSGQVKKVEASYIESGEIYISELIRTIESDAAQFEDYELQNAFLLRDSLIIKTTLDFNIRQHMARPYLLFPLLAQQQEEAIDFNLRAILTDAIVDEFIGTIPDDANKPAKEIALKFTKNALVNFTVANAFRKSLVKLTPQGLVEYSADKDTDQQIYAPGNADKIHQQISNFESMGNSYLSKAQNHLIINDILPAPEVVASKTFIA
jgi:hypothetical protein